MTTIEKLLELIGMEAAGEIYNDECEHENPAAPLDPCNVCFIRNMKNATLCEPAFSEETTERQREYIEDLWEQYANS